MMKQALHGFWYFEGGTGDTDLPTTSTHKNRADNDYIRAASLLSRWSTIEPTENAFVWTHPDDQLALLKNGANWTNGLARGCAIGFIGMKNSPDWFIASVLANGGSMGYCDLVTTSTFANLTTTSGATGTGTSFNVVDGSGLDVGAVQWSIIKIESEQIFVISKSGNTVTDCIRGIRGTTVVSHADAVTVAEKVGFRSPMPWEVWNGTVTTTLDGAIGATDTTINVAATTNFATPGMVTVDSEDIFYTGTTATSFTGCTRGQHGTTAASHANAATATNTTLRRQVVNTIQAWANRYDNDPYILGMSVHFGTKFEEMHLINDTKVENYATGNTWTLGGYTQAKHEAAMEKAIAEHARIWGHTLLLAKMNHMEFVDASDSTDNITTAQNVMNWVLANYPKQVVVGWTNVQDSMSGQGLALYNALVAHANQGSPICFHIGDFTNAQTMVNNAVAGGRTLYLSAGFGKIAVRVDATYASPISDFSQFYAPPPYMSVEPSEEKGIPPGEEVRQKKGMKDRRDFLKRYYQARN